MKSLSLVVVVLMFPSVAAESPHSDSVIRAEPFASLPHEWVQADEVPRGSDVKVYVTVRDAVQLDSLRLVYCRAEGYLCAPPLAMQPGQGSTWTGIIPWDRPDENRPARFWKGVTHVGYNLTLIHSNGTFEFSPVENFPDTPPGFPSDGKYYFYTLSPEPKKPIPGFPIGGVLLAALAAAFRKLATR